ncbi:MAG: hypothetical protein H8E30_16260 [Alphaproteobacteria bacterium]|nr:hypothetical protein [Alphaproteobacteria bacterium]
MKIPARDRPPPFSVYSIAFAPPAALLPLAGAALADVFSLKTVFIAALLAAALQFVLYARLSRWERG